MNLHRPERLDHRHDRRWFRWILPALALLGQGLVHAGCHGLVLHAHRGAPAAPENAMSGLQQAWSGDWDGAEIDVQTLRDGQWVLHHDPRLGRTTSLQGRASTDLGPEAWREIRLKDRQGRLTAESPPFLSDVVSQLAERDDKVLNIEVKQLNPSCPGVQGLAESLRRSRADGRWFLTAIARPVLQCARRGDPQGYLGQIVIDPQALARSNPRTAAAASRTPAPRVDRAWLQGLQSEVGKPVGVHVDINTLEANPQLLRDALALGMPVFSYHLGADRDHAAALRRHARQSGLLPTGAIIDGAPGAFCELLGRP
jgi:glycerophosphoryl diester phosphodiesterase